jgi:hypothetical protein
MNPFFNKKKEASKDERISFDAVKLTTNAQHQPTTHVKVHYTDGKTEEIKAEGLNIYFMPTTTNVVEVDSTGKKVKENRFFNANVKKLEYL